MTDTEQTVRCDECGGPIDSTDGYTDGFFTLCGSVYGNGCDSRTVHVAVYSVERNYGGPEEGGWWWDSGEVVHRETCRFYDLEETLRRLQKQYPHTGKRSSVLGGEDYSIDWDDKPPAAYWPEQIPDYE